jgi:hypothetical protein
LADKVQESECPSEPGVAEWECASVEAEPALLGWVEVDEAWVVALEASAVALEV